MPFEIPKRNGVILRKKDEDLNVGKLFFLLARVLAVIVVNLGVHYDLYAQTPVTVQEEPQREAESLPDTRNQPEDSAVLKTHREKVNYAIGVNLIGNFKQQGIDIDLDLVIKGMRDAFSGENLLLTDEELRKAVVQYHSEIQRRQSKARATSAEKNKKEGKEFLEANRQKNGVVTLPSGLQYRVVKTGKGKTPTDSDTVECHYKGTLINGTEFDSTYSKGHPAIFKVAEVIPGWREALKLMPVDSTWQLFIPPELAYGEKGASGPIGPNATLIFEVELLAIK